MFVFYHNETFQKQKKKHSENHISNLDGRKMDLIKMSPHRREAKGCVTDAKRGRDSAETIQTRRRANLVCVYSIYIIIKLVLSRGSPFTSNSNTVFVLYYNILYTYIS